jgi:ArsR family transcriptional regulator, virulence genes transcriptional regulator
LFRILDCNEKRGSCSALEQELYMNSTPIQGSIEENASEAEGLLSILANRRRLIILCNLMVAGELPVGELVRRLDLAQSALSQHLALMRAAGIVTTRREGTTIYYSLTDARTRALLYTIKELYFHDIFRQLEARESSSAPRGHASPEQAGAQPARPGQGGS